MVFVMERIMEAVRVPFYVFTLDFTIASDLWLKVRRDRLSALGRLAYHATRRYFSEKWGFPVEIAFDCSVQYWHSGSPKDSEDDSGKNPGDGYFPHVHAEVPRVFIERDTGRLVRGGRRGLQMKYIDESEIKKTWRFAVEQAYGRSSAVVAGGTEKFVVHTSYIKWRGHPRVGKGLDKRLRYAYRGTPKDVEEWIARNGLESEAGLVKDWDKEWMRWMLTLNHKRHQGYGLLAARNVSEKSAFMRHLCLKLGTRAERRRIRRHIGCPECAAVGLSSDTSVRFGDERELSYSDAKASGFKVWGVPYEDEDRKWKDFVPYHDEFIEADDKGGYKRVKVGRLGGALTVRRSPISSVW
jgi:hypothetical protein